MRHDRSEHRPTVLVELDGDLPASAEDYARTKVTDIVRLAPRPVLHAKVRLTHTGRAGHIEVVAHANLDVNGTPLISHSVGGTAREAVDLLQAKLRGQLGRM